jgi:hypothetical protein
VGLPTELASEPYNRVTQLGRVQNAETAANADKQARHPLQLVGLRAEDHPIGRFFERTHVRCDSSAGLVERDLEQDLHRPSPRRSRQRLQYVGDAVEIERPQKRVVA